MKRAVYFFKFYVKSSMHAALAVTSLSLVTSVQFGQSLNLSLLIFVFSATLVTYNFIKHAVPAKYYFLVKGVEIKKIQWLSFFAASVAVASFLWLSKSTRIVAFFFGIMSLLYAIPFPFQKQNFRNQWGIKIFLVAFCWSGVSVVLPMADTPFWNTPSFWEVWVQRYLLIIIWMLPFEIRDLEIDPPGLGTIPQRIGIPNTLLLGYFLLVICLIISIWLTCLDFPDLAMIAITSLLLFKSGDQQSPYFSSFWVESIPIIWLGFYAIKSLF